MIPEASISWELFETKNDNWLKDGWSFDFITTHKRAGLGIAKDIYKNKQVEVDFGGYVTNEYSNFKVGKIDPQVGVGANVNF